MDGKFTGTSLYEVGLALRARGEFFEARRVLRDALKLVPEHPHARAALADVEHAIRVRSRTS